MRIQYLPILLLLAASTAHSADPTYFKLDTLRQADTVKELASGSVKLYWGDEKTPAFAEVAPPDVYTSPSISLSPFGGSLRHCVDAFERALKSLVDDAQARGYDAVIHIRPVMGDKPSTDAQGFYCKPGYKTTEVPLSGTFAMTQAAMDRLLTQEQQAIAPRPAAKGAVFLPLGSMLTSPEAKAVLGPTINAYPGLEAPTYRLRYGPDEFHGEAKINGQSPQAACQQAVVDALGSMVETLKEKDLDMIIKVRSHFDDQYAPVPTDVECEVGKKVARVSLMASLAKRP